MLKFSEGVMQRFRDRPSFRSTVAVVVALCVALSACGRKGDPLPPATVTSAPVTTTDANTQ